MLEAIGTSSLAQLINEVVPADGLDAAVAMLVQALVIGGNAQAMAVSDAIRERGILVPAIRPPTVPEGTARLRISLSAAHEPQDVARLVESLRAVMPAPPRVANG